MTHFEAELRARLAPRALTFSELTGSTMEDARSLVRAGAGPGAVAVAERQAAGRGRLGRPFVSPAGGLYLTLVAEPPGDTADAWRCGFAAALAARDAIRAAGGPEVEFDWPNDLVHGDRKVGGILLELLTGSPPRLLIGVGLNLGPDPRAEDADAAEPAGPVPFPPGADPRAAVAARLLARLDELVPLCGTEAGWTEVLDRVRAVSRATRGARLEVVTPEGQRVTGAGVGLRSDGALLLRRADGAVVAIRYGDRVYDTPQR